MRVLVCSIYEEEKYNERGGEENATDCAFILGAKRGAA